MNNSKKYQKITVLDKNEGVNWIKTTAWELFKDKDSVSGTFVITEGKNQVSYNFCFYKDKKNKIRSDTNVKSLDVTIEELTKFKEKMLELVNSSEKEEVKNKIEKIQVIKKE